MNRRAFLLRSALAVGTAAASGCTTEALRESEREPPAFEEIDAEELDHPAAQPLGIAEAAIERADDEEIRTVGDFGAFLEDDDLDVEALGEEDRNGEPILALEYVAETTADRGLMHHLGAVAGGYAALAGADHDSERLEASVLDSDSAEYGEYEVRRRWADAYVAGALSARAYAAEIAVTVGST